MSYNSRNNMEYYYNGGFGANNDDDDDDFDIDMEDDLMQLLDEANKHSSSSDDDSLNNNNNVVSGRGGDRGRRGRSWKKYLVSWYWKCSELEEAVAENKRKKMGDYEVQLQSSGGGGGCWETVVVLGKALRNSRAVPVQIMNYNNDGIRRTSSSVQSPYLSLHKLDDDNGGLSSSSYYYGPIYLVT